MDMEQVFVIRMQDGHHEPCACNYLSSFGPFRGKENVLGYSDLRGAMRFSAWADAETVRINVIPLRKMELHKVECVPSLALIQFPPRRNAA